MSLAAQPPDQNKSGKDDPDENSRGDQSAAPWFAAWSIGFMAVVPPILKAVGDLIDHIRH